MKGYFHIDSLQHYLWNIHNLDLRNIHNLANLIYISPFIRMLIISGNELCVYATQSVLDGYNLDGIVDAVSFVLTCIMFSCKCNYMSTYEAHNLPCAPLCARLHVLDVFISYGFTCRHMHRQVLGAILLCHFLRYLHLINMLDASNIRLWMSPIIVYWN